jgi:preprotein translocase subunit SecA
LSQGIRNIKRNNPQVEQIVIPFAEGVRRLQILINVDEAIQSEGKAIIDELEKVVALSVIDNKWRNHLREMDELRQSVQTAVFEQKDPLLVYKFEAFELFQRALTDINQQVLSLLFRIELQVQESDSKRPVKTQRDDFSKLNMKHGSAAEERKRAQNAERAIMQNSGEENTRKLSRQERRAQERKDSGKGRFPKGR